MLIKIKKILPYLITILLITGVWFLKPGYIFLTDMAWGPNILIDWHSASFILNFSIKTLSFALPLQFVQKIFISAIFLLILYGGKSLVTTTMDLIKKNNDKSSVLVFAVSLFTLFNPFVYDRALYGQFGILAAYGFLLLLISSLISLLASLDSKHLIKVAIYSALTLMFAINFFFFIVTFGVLFVILLFFKREEIRRKYPTKKIIFLLLISSLIFLAINLNWLMTISFGSSQFTGVEAGVSQQDLIAFQTSGSSPLETLSNIIFMSGFWGKDQFRYFDMTTVPVWRASFIFLSPLILYGLWCSFKKKNKTLRSLSIGFIVIFFIAVLMALGIKTSITRDLTIFLHNNLPLYKSLREPQKWVATLIPIYLFYLTIGISYLKKFKFVQVHKKRGLIALAVIIIMQAPLLLFGFGRQVKPVEYPSDWYEMNEFIKSNSENCSDKVVFLPWHMYMRLSWTEHIIANPASIFFSCPTIVGTNMELGGIYDNSGDKDSLIITQWIQSNGQNEIPNIFGSNPKYILLTKDVDWKNYDWLNYTPNISLIKETTNLFLYEVEL